MLQLQSVKRKPLELSSPDPTESIRHGFTLGIDRTERTLVEPSDSLFGVESGLRMEWIDKTNWSAFYQRVLVDDVIPFWVRHGWDREHGGMLTALDRDGSIVDSDKSIWFQGRSAWMFSTLLHSPDLQQHTDQDTWREVAKSCIRFLQLHGRSETGKLYFSVTRDGQPLRMRRYFFSESFAAIGNAAYFGATQDGQAAEDAIYYWSNYLEPLRNPKAMQPKWESTRPMQGIGPFMIAIATAQEMRKHLGDVTAQGFTCTEWIDQCIDQIERYFFKPDLQVLMENVGPNGEIIDHSDGRMLNPGHAIECAWFLLQEGSYRQSQRFISLGLAILDCMWERGWDREYGGLYYFRDLNGLPVSEYWHDMKFWWPHCEAIIATTYAAKITKDPKYLDWHRTVHDWSFQNFSDPEHGEWFGYLHRDGRKSNSLKGSLWKGPFHLPRMLLLCAELWKSMEEPSSP